MAFLCKFWSTEPLNKTKWPKYMFCNVSYTQTTKWTTVLKERSPAPFLLYDRFTSGSCLKVNVSLWTARLLYEVFYSHSHLQPTGDQHLRTKRRALIKTLFTLHRNCMNPFEIPVTQFSLGEGGKLAVNWNGSQPEFLLGDARWMW